jgi:cytochrome c biogenesis protein
MKPLLHLIRSMRFAIAILTIVAIAATIGSILEQNQPTVVYINRYGEFWTTFFKICGLIDIYHAWWFFLLLGFMATSTGLCLWQNTPAMIKDMRSFRENKSMSSLRKLEHVIELPLHQHSLTYVSRVLKVYLSSNGYRYKVTDHANGALLLAARTGSTRRIGYLLIHAAMVLICAGGLIDGNVALRLALWSGQLHVETRDIAPENVPLVSRLPANAGSFRATMNLPEGQVSNTSMLPIGDGYLLQELPFKVRLKRFHIEHYANGQPKDFTSDIEIIDGASTLPATLKVNQPFTHNGVTLYQSGFADGGTQVTVNLMSLNGGLPQRVNGVIGNSSAILLNEQPYTIEFSDLRAINVFTKNDAPIVTDWNSRLKPGARVHDTGPSLAYRLRDKNGQAEEYLVYQKPVEIEGRSWFLFGHKNTQNNAMEFLRLPADSNKSLDSYRKFSLAMTQKEVRHRAANLVAKTVDDTQLATALELSTEKLLDVFSERGYRSIADMIPNNISNEEQMKIGRLYVNLLERAAMQLNTEIESTIIKDCLSAFSEVINSKMPALIQLDQFQQVNASGIQLTKAPGAQLVYWGAAMLALGVLIMYFVRERRLWVHINNENLLLAFTANRQSPTLNAEFENHQIQIQHLLGKKKE